MTREHSCKVSLPCCRQKNARDAVKELRDVLYKSTALLSRSPDDPLTRPFPPGAGVGALSSNCRGGFPISAGGGTPPMTDATGCGAFPPPSSAMPSGNGAPGHPFASFAAAMAEHHQRQMQAAAQSTPSPVPNGVGGGSPLDAFQRFPSQVSFRAHINMHMPL